MAGESESDEANADSSDDIRLESVERRAVQAALERASGNVSEAARLLGVSRGALRHRIEKWGLG